MTARSKRPAIGRTVRIRGRDGSARCIVLLLICCMGSTNFRLVRSSQDNESRNDFSPAMFKSLAREYIDDLHSRHPMLAAWSGNHSWDGRLEDFSPAAVSDEISTIKRFQARLEHIQKLGLSISDLFDYQIISSNIRSRLLELEHVKSYERNPQLYSDIISTSLLYIALFEYAPQEERVHHIVSKEQQIPRFLESARSNVSHPNALLSKIAAKSFQGTLTFVRDELPRAFSGISSVTLRKNFEKSTQAAAEAIAKHIKHLEAAKPDATASFAIGKQNFEAKLRYDEGIDIPIGELLKIGYRELARTQEAFRAAAAQIDGKRAAIQVWADVQKEHPRPGSLVEEAAKQLDRIKRFIAEKRIVSMPPNPSISVMESPDFLRWSTASMWTPGPFETRRLGSRYLITDVDPKWSEKQREEYLSSINYPQLWTTTIHEAYPGHFVQGEFLKRVDSAVRKTAAFMTGTFVEGWAHYAEQMMLDEGFGAGDPKLRLGQLADALLRLCRWVVAIRLHTEGLTVEQGTTFFMQNAYMAETPSRIEAERGTFDPMYLVYAVGKMAIFNLREDYRRYRGAEFSLQEFHDRFLSVGNAPLWIHRQALMPGDKGRLIQ